MKIILNKYGEAKYPHLADVWLKVYGYNNNEHSFIVWDYVCNDWVLVLLSECEGEVDE